MANNKLLVTLEAKDNLTSTIEKTSKEIKDLKNEVNNVGRAANSLDNYKAKFETIKNSSGSVEKKLKQLQKLASDMQFSGFDKTGLFTQVAMEAGMAKDAISDARTAISRFADDNLKLTAATQGFSAIAAGGSMVAGVMGMLGDKSEFAEQAILKVQSAIALLNGVTQIANVLNNDSAFMQRYKQILLTETAEKSLAETVKEGIKVTDLNASSSLARAAAAGANTKATEAETATKIGNTTAQGANTAETEANSVSKANNAGATDASTAANVRNAASVGNLTKMIRIDTATNLKYRESRLLAAEAVTKLEAAEKAGMITAEQKEAGANAIAKAIGNRTLSEAEMINILAKHGAVEQSVAQMETTHAEIVAKLDAAVKAGTISVEQQTAALVAWRQAMIQGSVTATAAAGIANKYGLTLSENALMTGKGVLATEAATAAMGKNGKAMATLVQKANAVSKALLGVKLATAGWLALAGAAVYAIYKLITYKDEYVKQLEEEADKLREDIKHMQNMTNEQQRAAIVVDALKRKKEELNAVYEREKSYISNMGQSFGTLMSKYKDLQFQYNHLKNDHEKIQWIKNNQQAFQELGLKIDNVVDAEKWLNQNTDTVVEAMKLRAKAAAAAAIAMEKYKEAMQLEESAGSTGMRGATMSVEDANKLPENLRNQLVKNTHTEISATKMYQAQYGGGSSISDQVIDSYSVPLDASEDFLRQLAAHGFQAKKAARNAKKSMDEANKWFDKSVGLRQKASAMTGARVVPEPKQDKPTNNTTTTKPKTRLGEMEEELSKLKDQRVNIDITAPNANEQIAEINRQIRQKEKEIKDYKIQVGAEVDEEAVEGSIEWLNKQISNLQTMLNKRKLPLGLTFDQANQQLKDWKKQLEQEQVRLGLKVVPDKGSVADIDRQIQEIQQRLQNENLPMSVRIDLNKSIQELNQKKEEITHGKLTIPATIEPTMSTSPKDLFDLRQSRENAKAAIDQIVSDWEAGIIKSKEEAEKAIDEINAKLKGLDIKPIEVKVEAKGVSKTIQGIESVAGAAADAFTALGDAAESPELNIAGLIAGGVASIIQGYGQATAQASSLGPWAWIAFGIAATAQLISMMAAVTQVKDQAGYAQGGIVTGASSYGDMLGINVNAGEMVLTKQQQGKLWNEINSNKIETPDFSRPRIVGKLMGRDFVLMMQNESRVRNKAGLSVNIK